jgi:hypothetical protein
VAEGRKHSTSPPDVSCTVSGAISQDGSSVGTVPVTVTDTWLGVPPGGFTCAVTALSRRGPTWL